MHVRIYTVNTFKVKIFEDFVEFYLILKAFMHPCHVVILAAVFIMAFTAPQCQISHLIFYSVVSFCTEGFVDWKFLTILEIYILT